MIDRNCFSWIKSLLDDHIFGMLLCRRGCVSGPAGGGRGGPGLLGTLLPRDNVEFGDPSYWSFASSRHNPPQLYHDRLGRDLEERMTELELQGRRSSASNSNVKRQVPQDGATRRGPSVVDMLMKSGRSIENSESSRSGGSQGARGRDHKQTGGLPPGGRERVIRQLR
jgi:hypothetical protein